jgi:hypothetical protein
VLLTERRGWEALMSLVELKLKNSVNTRFGKYATFSKLRKGFVYLM